MIQKLLPAVVLGLSASLASAQVDLSGPWGAVMHEDSGERREGPEVGDYTGLPITEAARFKAQTWTASKWSVLEHQCEPHPADYSPNFSPMLMTKVYNEDTWDITAYKMTMAWMNPTRTIWLDGREHPSENAPHTWEGFSTGEWHGDVLVVTTTHLKEGWIRRNGIPRSDQATLTEYWMRDGDTLTLVSIIDDPVYLEEPFIRSRNFVEDLGYQMTRYTCSYRDETGMPKDFVPHILPGENDFLYEFAHQYGLSRDAVMGGARTMYPEYRGAPSTE